MIDLEIFFARARTKSQFVEDFFADNEQDAADLILQEESRNDPNEDTHCDLLLKPNNGKPVVTHNLNKQQED